MRSPSASASSADARRGGRSWRSPSAPAGAAAASPPRARARSSRSRRLPRPRRRALQVPLVQHDRGRAARLHRQLGDAQVLGGDARRSRRRPRAPRRRARRRAGSAARCSTRPSPRPSPGGACPAVSISVTLRSPTLSGVSIASRVVPASSETITRSSPRKRLTSEDLPTFGRPITARRIASVVGLGLAPPGSSSTIRSSRSPVPSPCAAETASGSPRPRRWNSAAQRDLRDGVALVGRDDARQRRSGAAGRPAPRRPGARPARASTTSTATCASASPARACSRIERGQRVLVAEVHAAGVDQRERARPFHSQASSLRSRVTPGRSCTTASRGAA